MVTLNKSDLTDVIFNSLSNKRKAKVPLKTETDKACYSYNKKWKIIENIELDLEFLGTPIFKKTIHNNTFTYRFETEIDPVVVQKLKIEINTREHSSIQNLQKKKHGIESSWYWFSRNNYVPEVDYNIHEAWEVLGSLLMDKF